MLTGIEDNTLILQIEEEQGHDKMQVVSYGLQLLVINDNEGNFLPVLGISLSEFFYSFKTSI